MKQNIREFLMQKALVLFRSEDIDVSARDFMSTYASYMREVGIVGKEPNGHVVFPSRTAPVEEGYAEFFDEWVTLSEALEIHTAVSMDLYTDAWFARDPKYQTMTASGQLMPHQICPNREEFWEYGAEIVKELGAYPIDEILLFGVGFIRDEFCFCDRCRKEFAPLVDQEPARLTHAYLTENPDYHDKWHEWRTEKVLQGLRVLQSAADSLIGAEGTRFKPLKISVEVLVDPESGLTEGAKKAYGYDYTKIREITGGLMINLFPWSPVLPTPGTAEYNDLVESMYFVKEFSRRGGIVSLFRWGVSSIEQLRELKALGKDVGIDRFVTSFGYPKDYPVRRESAIGNY
jgi:hypothetical protein